MKVLKMIAFFSISLLAIVKQMLTTPKSAKKASAGSSWPSLSSPSTSSGAASFFDEKIVVQNAGKKNSKAQPVHQVMEKSEETPEDEADDEKFKTPSYHQLGDCLADALQRQMQYGVSSKSGKKKNKKTLLFSSGLNFN